MRIGEVEWNGVGREGLQQQKKQSNSVEWVQHTFSREALVVRTNFGKAAEENNRNDILDLYFVWM